VQHTTSRRGDRVERSGRHESRRPTSSRWASRFITLLFVGGLGWYAYAQYNERMAPAPATSRGLISAPAPVEDLPARSAFQCDGRQHCSQMTSCQEAKQFLKNCPDMKMDGDRDGIPCEEQWCSGLLGG
jgi:Excalibur calcium-binding domain